MNIYDVKKVAQYTIDDIAPVSEVRSIKETFKIIKRSRDFNKLLCNVHGIVTNRLYNNGYDIDEFAGCEVTAYNSTDYVISFLLFVSQSKHKILENTFHRAWAYVAFTYENSVFKINCTMPTIMMY